MSTNKDEASFENLSQNLISEDVPHKKPAEDPFNKLQNVFSKYYKYHLGGKYVPLLEKEHIKRLNSGTQLKTRNKRSTIFLNGYDEGYPQDIDHYSLFRRFFNNVQIRSITPGRVSGPFDYREFNTEPEDGAISSVFFSESQPKIKAQPFTSYGSSGQQDAVIIFNLRNLEQENEVVPQNIHDTTKDENQIFLSPEEIPNGANELLILLAGGKDSKDSFSSNINESKTLSDKILQNAQYPLGAALQSKTNEEQLKIFNLEVVDKFLENSSEELEPTSFSKRAITKRSNKSTLKDANIRIREDLVSQPEKTIDAQHRLKTVRNHKRQVENLDKIRLSTLTETGLGSGKISPLAQEFDASVSDDLITEEEINGVHNLLVIIVNSGDLDDDTSFRINNTKANNLIQHKLKFDLTKQSQLRKPKANLEKKKSLRRQNESAGKRSFSDFETGSINNDFVREFMLRTIKRISQLSKQFNSFEQSSEINKPRIFEKDKFLDQLVAANNEAFDTSTKNNSTSTALNDEKDQQSQEQSLYDSLDSRERKTILDQLITYIKNNPQNNEN